MRTDCAVTKDDNILGEQLQVSEYERYGLELVAAVDTAIRPWLLDVLAHRFGGDIPPASQQRAEAAVEAAAAEAHRLLTELATADPATPLSGPLERLRRSVSPVTDLLGEAQAQRPRRDPVDIEMRPDDVFAIGPLAFTDLSAEVHDAGITWGAAKAYMHTQRVRTSIDQPDDSTA